MVFPYVAWMLVRHHDDRNMVDVMVEKRSLCGCDIRASGQCSRQWGGPRIMSRRSGKDGKGIMWRRVAARLNHFEILVVLVIALANQEVDKIRSESL